MIDYLVTPLTTPLSFTYVDDSGGISTCAGTVECFINTQQDVTETWKNLINKMNNSINIINGYSSVITNRPEELSTSKFVIRNNSNIKVNIPMFGYLGSIHSVIVDSLKAEMATIISQLNQQYSNVYVKFVPNEHFLNLMYFTYDGFDKRVYTYSYEYNDDNIKNRNTQAITFLDNLRNKFKNLLLCDVDMVGNDYYYKGDCILESNYVYEDVLTHFKSDIEIKFKHIITDANIKNINFNQII